MIVMMFAPIVVVGAAGALETTVMKKDSKSVVSFMYFYSSRKI